VRGVVIRLQQTGGPIDSVIGPVLSLSSRRQHRAVRPPETTSDAPFVRVSPHVASHHVTKKRRRRRRRRRVRRGPGGLRRGPVGSSEPPEPPICFSPLSTTAPSSSSAAWLTSLEYMAPSSSFSTSRMTCPGSVLCSCPGPGVPAQTSWTSMDAGSPRAVGSPVSTSSAGSTAAASEKDVRSAQKMPVGPYIPVGIQLEKAGVGPTSGPTRRRSHSGRPSGAASSPAAPPGPRTPRTGRSRRARPLARRRWCRRRPCRRTSPSGTRATRRSHPSPNGRRRRQPPEERTLHLNKQREALRQRKLPRRRRRSCRTRGTGRSCRGRRPARRRPSRRTGSGSAPGRRRRGH
jgi:hypothetical protein